VQKVNFFRYNLNNIYLVIGLVLTGVLVEIILQIWIQNNYLCFLGIYYCIFSLSFLFFLYKILYPFYILKRWNKVIAKITKIEVLEMDVSNSYGVLEIYQFLLEYEYEIKSRVYTANRIAFDKDSTMIYGNKNLALNIKDKYINKSIAIYCNPNKLKNSVIIVQLSKRQKNKYIILMLLSLFMLSFGYFLFQNGFYCK